AVREVRLLRLRPAAEDLIDGEEIDLRELAGVLGRGRRVDRTVVVAAGDVLAFGRIQVLEVRGGDGAGALLVDHLVDDRHRGLGQDGRRRRDDVELVRTQL